MIHDEIVRALPFKMLYIHTRAHAQSQDCLLRSLLCRCRAENESLHACAQAHARTHTHTDSHMHTHTHTDSHMHTYTHTRMHAYTHTQMRLHLLMRSLRPLSNSACHCRARRRSTRTTKHWSTVSSTCPTSRRSLGTDTCLR